MASPWRWLCSWPRRAWQRPGNQGRKGYKGRRGQNGLLSFGSFTSLVLGSTPAITFAMRSKKRRVVVVTGASAGVGRATVRAFAERGDSIGLIARGVDGLE